jgi:hypothetical protein
MAQPTSPEGKTEVPSASLTARTAGMKHLDGLLPLDWDAKAGKLYLEVRHHDVDLLWTNSLPYGTGSNDLGLDRGQTAPGRIVRFQRRGPKLLLVEPNERFRSSSADPAERFTIQQSFPESVLWGFKVEAEDPDGTVLVDATDFFLRDVHNVTEALARTQQGVYKVDATRSAIAMESTRAFPKNTEVEAILTFTTDGPARGEFVRDVTPDPRALTLREHQTFLELPGPGFTPRRFDPRAGFFPTTYRDYSAPLGEPLDQQFILRHRLLKKDPACKSACEPQAPIQYYVDNGAPEPIRSALLEGARWWDTAFQAAGWAKGTFKVDVLPAGADPMDVRYNMIQWVHRYTRGWSYGAAIADPRTGEIIKGNVTLGSLRGRQDYLIAEALLSPYVTGKTITSANDPMLAMVLQRIRQLAAHETGHTLGLAHNFAATAFPHTNPDETISVMDYPHPYIFIDKEGRPDLSHAYPVGIGVWDKVAIDFGYREFDLPFPDGKQLRPTEPVRGELNTILARSEKAGVLFLTDEDSRPPGGAHPHAHLWDNGTDAADELTRILAIRSSALARFGENAIKPGAPLAQLEDTLVPLYLLHRYQTEAAIKEIGGLDYRYNLRGDGQPLPQIVSPDDQKKALTVVLRTLSTETLTLPESLLALLPPLPPGLERTRESFPSHTGLTFDPVAAAESAADLTLQLLFNPQRASRLVEYHNRNPACPQLSDIFEAAMEAVRPQTPPQQARPGLQNAVAHAVYLRTVEAALALAANPAASPEARAVIAGHLADLKTRPGFPGIVDDAVVHRIEEFERDPAKFIPAKSIDAPPGMPIGDDEVF